MLLQQHTVIKLENLPQLRVSFQFNNITLGIEVTGFKQTGIVTSSRAFTALKGDPFIAQAPYILLLCPQMRVFMG
ncbi:hypothetical protein NGUA33_03734 [Salmonella enterica]|nr:hypothetical protein NGUA33_03734 [Salmonella enterica]